MGRPVTADKPLTVKQTQFAAAVGEGKPKAAAYRQVYSHDPKYRDANARKALDLADAPHVAAEIRRLTWLSCPPVDDIRGMREHSVRVLSDLSRSAKSEDVRLKAALALYRIAETTRAAADPRASDQEQDRTLDALRKLYRQIQTTANKTIEGESVELPPDTDTPDVGPRVKPDDEPIDLDALAPRE